MGKSEVNGEVFDEIYDELEPDSDENIYDDLEPDENEKEDKIQINDFEKRWSVYTRLIPTTLDSTYVYYDANDDGSRRNTERKPNPEQIQKEKVIPQILNIPSRSADPSPVVSSHPSTPSQHSQPEDSTEPESGNSDAGGTSDEDPDMYGPELFATEGILVRVSTIYSFNFIKSKTTHLLYTLHSIKFLRQ